MHAHARLLAGHESLVMPGDKSLLEPPDRKPRQRPQGLLQGRFQAGLFAYVGIVGSVLLPATVGKQLSLFWKKACCWHW